MIINNIENKAERPGRIFALLVRHPWHEYDVVFLGGGGLNIWIVGISNVLKSCKKWSNLLKGWSFW